MAFLLPLTEVSSISYSATIKRPQAFPSPAAVAASSSRARVCSSAVRITKEKALVIRVSDPVRDKDAILPLLSGPELTDLTSLSEADDEGKRGGGGDDKRKYYVNLGNAIRTLREELPVIFYREPSFDIYRDDIVFKNPVNTLSGIENYKLVYGFLRITGRILFKTSWVDIVSIWQPFENIIMIRWTAHVVLRAPWENHGRLDGICEYKLDKEGKIYEHRVHNVAINSPPKFRVRTVEELILSLGCPSTPKPTCFEKISYFAVSTWMRYCLSLYPTLARRLAERG